MTTYDFSPLYRSSIGFDRLARLMDATLQSNGTASSYPPYDIAAIGDDHYRISMAVAGFGEADLNIEVHKQTLSVSGKSPEEDRGAEYLHRGISGRDFVRKFQLADHVNVGGASLVNGLLVIDLEREIPEEMKPRHIEIGRDAPRGLAEKAKKLVGAATKTKAA